MMEYKTLITTTAWGGGNLWTFYECPPEVLACVTLKINRTNQSMTDAANQHRLVEVSASLLARVSALSFQTKNTLISG